MDAVHAILKVCTIFVHITITNISVTMKVSILSNDNEMKSIFENNIKKLGPSSPLSSVSEYVKDNLQEITKSELVFTDDLAPVDVLGQSLLNDIVKDGLKNFKEKVDFEHKGIDGIFDLLK